MAMATVAGKMEIIARCSWIIGCAEGPGGDGFEIPSSTFQIFLVIGILALCHGKPTSRFIQSIALWNVDFILFYGSRLFHFACQNGTFSYLTHS